MTSNNIIEFDVKCNRCKRLIEEEEVYYEHSKYGYVCMYCPEFNDGPVTVIFSDELMND